MKIVCSALAVNLRNTELTFSVSFLLLLFQLLHAELKMAGLDAGIESLFKNSGLIVNLHNLGCHN